MAGQRPDQYLESFSWDAAKFPPRRALNETVSAITENVQKLEDDLKVKLLHIWTSGYGVFCQRLPSSSHMPALHLCASWAFALRPLIWE